MWQVLPTGPSWQSSNGSPSWPSPAEFMRYQHHHSRQGALASFLLMLILHPHQIPTLIAVFGCILPWGKKTYFKVINAEYSKNVQLAEFPRAEHTHVTSTQIKKQKHCQPPGPPPIPFQLLCTQEWLNSLTSNTKESASCSCTLYKRNRMLYILLCLNSFAHHRWWDSSTLLCMVDKVLRWPPLIPLSSLIHTPSSSYSTEH